MAYQYYLFDWDGCLAKTLDVWMGVYTDLYAKAGIKVTPELIIEYSWGNLAEGPKYFGVQNYQDFWQQIVAEVQKRVQTVPLYEGAKKIIHHLKSSDKKIAIVTTSENKLVEPALKFYGLDTVIDALVTEKQVTKPKPDPEIVNLAMSKIGAKQEETLIIGDSAKDIVAGQNAYIATCLVLHPDNSRFYNFDKLKSSNPSHVVVSLEEITRI